jgi:hypothetical protein
VNLADRPTAPGNDPGLGGGLAVLRPDGSVRLHTTPFLPAGAGTKQDEAAAIASCARRDPDVGLLMAPEHVASPGIRRRPARSPPPWAGGAPPRGQARGPGPRVRSCPGGPVRPRSQTTDRNFYPRRNHGHQQEFDPRDDPADRARPAADRGHPGPLHRGHPGPADDAPGWPGPKAGP